MSYLAEQNVIGSLLMDMTAMDKIYSMLSADMFTSDLLGRIYKEFQRGYDNHYDVTAVVLEQRLRSDNYPSNLILQEIRDCMTNTVTSTTVSAGACVIVNDYKARRLTETLKSVKVSAANIESQIMALREELEVLQGVKKEKAKTLAEIVKENKGKYFCELETEPLYLGFPQIDNLLGGLEGGDMIVIGARPGTGKSALVTQITKYLADLGKRIAFYNMEMKEKQVYERFLVAESEIKLTRLKRARYFLSDEKERFERANEMLEKQENIVLATGRKSISEIRVESLHMDYDIIIIDYLQLVKADKSYKGNRYAEVGEVSRSIKELAMELNIPIIALSQMNRLSEGREDREPTMSELREAGDIEQDASIILLLWNMAAGDDSKKGAKVAKNRQGTTGKVVLKFHGDVMKFTEVNKEHIDNWEGIADNCPFK